MTETAREFRTGRTTHEGTKIVASGTELFLQALLVLNHMIKMADGGSNDDLMLAYNVEAVKKDINDSAQALNDVERSAKPKENY